MKNNWFLLIVICILSLVSCRNDFDFENSSGSDLRFSRDTVYLDTIFSNIGSSTYTLKVYNTTNNDIKIPSLKLAKGEDSNFRLMVDGIAGKVFNNVEILAKDSMFIFVETTVDIQSLTNQKEFLYTDKIEFSSGLNSQKVELVTLVKDAVFLYPQKFADGTIETLPLDGEEIEGFFLDENDRVNGNELIWTNKKPYVIYGYAAVPPNKTLEIEAGAQIHFHDNSGLLVASNGTINVVGTIEKPVTFQGDRLEPTFENIPGQWGAIWLTVGSKGNFENAIIKNATVGLLINKNQSTVNLHNLQVYNASDFGILGRAASIFGTNVVTNNCGQTALACTFGGSYHFIQSTFANYWNKPNQTSVVIDNYDGSPEFAIDQALFQNCIIYGSSSESLIMNMKGNQNNFNIKFDNSLIKFVDYSNQVFGTFPYDFNNSTYFSNCLIARSSQQYRPYFKNTSKNEMMITDKSTDIIGIGNVNFAQQAPFDLNGISRIPNPDLGAYQNISETE